MRNLQKLASRYIENISENIYRLDNYERDKEQILEAIVLEKYKKALTDFTFREEDLALVRIVNQENFPINLEYFPLDDSNSYRYIKNPFEYILSMLKFSQDRKMKEILRKGGLNRAFSDLVYKITDIGYDKSKIETRENRLIAYRYRDTKHFSINGLASNIYGPLGHTTEFDKDSIAIIIEPLTNKINDRRLVNLNPVDTFFNLKNSSMKIGENSILMIQEDQLNFILHNDEIKGKLKNIFIYNEETSLAVDLVLMYSGYIPQHSKQQCILEPECTCQNGKKVSDQQYLNKFKEFIDQLNRKYLDTTYINAPSDISKKREISNSLYIGLPGILHSETSYFNDELKKNLQESILTYEAYISYIFSKSSSVDMQLIRKIIESVKRDVEDLSPIFEPSFFATMQEYEFTLLKVIEDLTYPEFKRNTEEFNEKKLSKINIKRRG